MGNLPWIGAGALGGIAIGLLIGFVVWAGASQPVAHKPPPEIAPPADRAVPASPAPIAIARDSVPVEHVSPAPEAAIPPVVRGDGVLDGVVKLADGTPLPNFTFGLRPASYLYQKTSAELNRMSAEEQIAEAARRIRWTEAATLMATTNQDGTFRFDGLVRSPSLEQYYFSRVPDGFRLGIRSGAGSSGIRAGQTLEIVATRRVLVELRVLAQGMLLPHAIVRAVAADSHSTGSSAFDRWSPERPFVEVSPGLIRFHADSPTDGDASATKVVEIPAEGLGRPVELHIERPRGIYVRLIAPLDYAGYSAEPVPPAWTNPVYTHLCFAFPSTVNPVELRGTSIRTQGTQLSLRRGSDYYSYIDPPPGQYVIAVTPTDQYSYGYVLTTAAVEITDESVYLDIHLPEQHEHEHIVMRVRSPDGEPISTGLIFEMQFHSYSSWPTSRRRVPISSRGDGVWWAHRDKLIESLDGPTSDRRFQHPSRVDVLVQHREYGEAFVQHDFASNAPIDVRFEAPAKLTVKVEGMTDEHLGLIVLAVVHPGANIVGELRHAAGSIRAGAWPLSTGEQEFTPLAPGPRVIALGRRSSPTGSNAILLADQRVELKSGENQVTLRMPRLHSLELSVPAPTPRSLPLQRLQAGSASETIGDSVSMTLGEDGIWRAEHLPAGEYLVRIYGRGEGRVQVPSHGTVTLEINPFNAWEVAGLDQQGIAFEKGLHYKDIVTALNGNRHEGVEALNEAMRSAHESATVVLTVVRDGRTMIVTFTGNEFHRAQQAGLSIFPRRLP